MDQVLEEGINKSMSHLQEDGQAQKVNIQTLERFGPYRKPTEVTIPKYQKIQEKALEMALLIDELCPHSQQKSSALTLLEQCKMSANAAIAIHS